MVPAIVRPDHHLIAGLLGWFAGAVIAEWRIGRLDTPGARRAATLERHTVTRYLTVEALALAGITATALVALLLASGARTGTSGAWWGWVAYTGALVVTCALTAGAVMRRPSGFVDSDVRDADDARKHARAGGSGRLGHRRVLPRADGIRPARSPPRRRPDLGDRALGAPDHGRGPAQRWWVAVWEPSARGRRGSPSGCGQATQPVHAVPAGRCDLSAPRASRSHRRT